MLKNKIKNIVFQNSFLAKKIYFIPNFYKTSYEKNVLISYVTKPFKIKNHSDVQHSNWQEAIIIASIFRDFGYNVDLVEFNVNVNIKFSKYDVIFGLGTSYENSFNDTSFKGSRIYYVTGAYAVHQNHAEIKRVLEIKKKRQVYLPPKRIAPFYSLSCGLSDALIIIGNEWTKNTYLPFCKAPAYTINATGLSTSKVIERNISEARKKFFWFGSIGLVHKGLDLCLEYFSQRPDMELHICGMYEQDFFDAFKKELELPNIHFHGFINVQSDTFINIVSQCLFTILPSCSEGQATSLLTTMGTGLIPVATIQTGIDISSLGFEIPALTVEGVASTIGKIDAVSNDDLLILSVNAKRRIEEKHSIEYFSQSMELLLSKILKK